MPSFDTVLLSDFLRGHESFPSFRSLSPASLITTSKLVKRNEPSTPILWAQKDEKE